MKKINDFTQHHHWGTIDHGIRRLLWQTRIADEFLWEFMQPEEILENMFGLDKVNEWLDKGGGFLVTDRPDPLPRFHDIVVWAYHPDPKMLTWISLQMR
jgi:hypothetical protein